jgi:hypothetical protein
LLYLWFGALLGLVVNPFFPQNLMFYWEQIVQIAVVNYQHVIGVGNEWYPYGFASLWEDLPLLFILAAAAIAAFPAALGAKRGEGRGDGMRVAIALSSAAFIFFAMTLRSRRHVEYFVPLAMLAVGSWMSLMPWQKIAAFMKKNAVPATLLGACLLMMTAAYAGNSFARARKDLGGTYRYTLFKGASEYLAANSGEGEVVIHSDWDQMPPLFWWNSKNRYMMGLDPTFLYNASRERYRDYVDFTLGKSPDPAKTMNTFGSRYAIIDKGHDGMRRMIEGSGRFEKAYSDSEADVYILK